MTTLQEVSSWLTKPTAEDVPTTLTVVEDADVELAIDAPVDEPTEVPAIVPATADTPSAAMARLLEIAARNAEELVAEATTEAEQMTTSARAEADEMLEEARRECAEVRTEADELRQAEQQHRARMRDHLTELLAKLDATPVAD